MGKKGRSSQLLQATDVLQSLLEHNRGPLSDQFLRWKVWKNWEDIVGPTISKNSMPVGYHKGELYVWVKNSVWMQEFLFIAGPLKEKVNKFVGRKWIKFVKFTLNRQEVPGFDSELAEKSILNSKKD